MAADLARLAELTRQFKAAVAGSKLERYSPYPWQRRFHEAGRDNPERMLMAANGTGKTHVAGAECAIHATGDYDGLPRTLRFPETLPNGEQHPNAGELVWPDGWQGKRFNNPVEIWTGSPTNETSKRNVQPVLLGGLGDLLGTGWIPKSKIVGQPTTRQAGVKGVIDTVRVQSVFGGTSLINLNTYEQGWQKWQGGRPHVIWLDEEPEHNDGYMIFSESQTRILRTNGIIIVTFTPMLGVTELVEHFRQGGDGIYLQGATWDNAPHLNIDERKRLAASYRDHEREARVNGVPMMGEGAVFPVPDSQLSVHPFKIPGHWARIKGCDFGIDHPAAGVEIAIDREADIIYLVDCYKKKDETAVYHAAWFNKNNHIPYGKFIPVAWPHDGMNREKSGGKTLADHYRSHGVNMMNKSARYPKAPGETVDKGGPQPIEPIVDEMLERMTTGRFKAFSTLSDFFEEKRGYHRKDGKIVAMRDDILKALFYAVMMRRYAVAPDSFGVRQKIHTPSGPSTKI